MRNSIQEKNKAINFQERYSNYTDAQVLEILKNRKGYQENAINAAVEIAIERQLIHSEQDLLSPEYQEKTNTSFTLFPQITNAFHHKKLSESIFRILYILSLLPIIYGLLKFSEGFIERSILGVCIGISWLLLVILLKRTQNQLFLIPLYGLLLITAGAILFSITTTRPIRFFDFVVLVIGVFLAVYSLIFAKKLTMNKPEIQ